VTHGEDLDADGVAAMEHHAVRDYVVADDEAPGVRD
jgi:hypothetical protein